MSDVAAIKVAIRRADEERQRLEAERDALAQQLAAALGNTASGAFEFDPARVRSLKHDLAFCDARLSDTTDRIAALTARLPSPTAIGEAEARVVVLQREIAEAQRQFDAALMDYVTTLAAAEETALALNAKRAAVSTLIHTLNAIVAATGLDVHVPALPVVPATVKKLAFSQSLLIGTIAEGQLDPEVERELQAAKAAQAAVTVVH